MGNTDVDPTLGNSQVLITYLSAAGESIDEMGLPSNDEPTNKSRKRVYPVPEFTTKKVTGHGAKASYSIASKLKTVEFSKMLCPDGKAVGNTCAAKVLGPVNYHPSCLDGRGAALALTAAPEAEKLLKDLICTPLLALRSTLRAILTASGAKSHPPIQEKPDHLRNAGGIYSAAEHRESSP